jgi:putative oxidoreductase
MIDGKAHLFRELVSNRLAAPIGYRQAKTRWSSLMTVSTFDQSARLSAPSLVPAFGRFLIAVIFLLSGIGKIFAPEATQGYIAAAGLPLPVVGYAIALLAEVGGGLLLLLGYQTRYAALGLAIFTVAAAIGFHHNFADQNQMIHFLKNFAITGGLLQVFAFGPGSFSLDARAKR